MPQPTFQPADYSVPCPRCAEAVMLPRNAGRRQRKTCAGCGYVVAVTWTEGTILLAAYPAALPRRDFAPPPPPPAPAPAPAPPRGRHEAEPPVPGRLAPPMYPQTKMEPVFPRPSDSPPGPGPVFVPAQETPQAGDGPDWEAARRRVSRAMNGLR